MSIRFQPKPEVTLASKVAFLQQPTSYLQPRCHVESVETHMSWVFLTKEFAYKLKKPAYCELLDFSTIEARRHYCEEEVRLNRRLADEVYQGVVALVSTTPGQLQLGGDGTVVDWLVKMRRLSTQHMLDQAIRDGAILTEDIVRVAARLATFYQTCPFINIAPSRYRELLLHNIDLSLRELSMPAHQLPVEQINRIWLAQHSILQKMAQAFDERVHARRIVEGHGDLRPEHICLKPTLSIIDCLEFSRRLRIVDTVDELAFLALECERLGAADLSALLLQTYSDISGDKPGAILVHFYQSYRAVRRAAIAIRHLNEEKFCLSPQWQSRACEYLQLAERHVVCCR